ELGKHVIGLGMQDSTSELLRDNCDEFIYYEDLGRTATLPAAIPAALPETKKKAFELLLDSLLALRRENKEVLWSSMVKDTMKRKNPSFNESYHGYRTFSELLEDAKANGLLELDTDKKSRTYVVTAFGSELTVRAPAAAKPPRAESADGKPEVRRRRSRNGSGGRSRSRRPAATAPATGAEPASATPLEPAPPPPPPPPPAPEPPLPPRRKQQGESLWAAAVELGLEPDN